MKTTLMIDGMSCEHCVEHVVHALESLNGVSSAKVSLKGKNAVVEHDNTISPEVLKNAVIEAGYDVKNQ